MSDRPTRNPFFPLTAILSALFVLTVLATVAATFSDERAPLAKLLDRHGTTLIVIEVAAILFVGLLALTVDRAQAPKRNASESPAAESPTPPSSPLTPDR